MALIEGYPELNAYALGEVSYEDSIQHEDVTKDAFMTTKKESKVSKINEITQTNQTQEKANDQSEPSLDGSELNDKELQDQKSTFALELQLQKTKLCRYHMKGLCKHGNDCRFAHGSSQLVQPPNLHKTRMCPDFLAGKQCTNPNCTFAHDESELKKVNICHKTALCSWFLAGTCRNGSECSFAHGEHELKGNAKNQAMFQRPASNTAADKMESEPMFVKAAPELPATQVQVPVTNTVAPPPNPYLVPQQQMPGASLGPQGARLAPPLPSMPPPAAPPMIPGYVNGMHPCMSHNMSGYPMMPQHDVRSTPFNLMAPTFVPPFPDLEINGVAPALPVCAVPPSAAPVSMPPPGLPAPPGLLHPAMPPSATEQSNHGNSGNKNVQLTELTVQINMLSEEVRRLQRWIVPTSMQSTASGSPMGSPDRTPPSDQNQEDNDTRSFEQKVASLQDELKRVISEGQRSGKIPMKGRVQDQLQ
eukprot:gnl/MRDRNA2_/MRDRNA2_31474_c0_seq1.p1 gnl/MRDRNA2_/MRDRNA2_31474_c0~~gnl/MRDRNA2_/MRDRNA2_31474_c0_seq1.p1  ORF type:complete len:475 (-),score=89.44 gnl/MRDRNA2_/MRDRNA2_31474_c0_seq1:174-1598(-)